MQRSPAAERRQAFWRQALRALNGAGIGAVLGSLLGGLLGIVASFVVTLLWLPWGDLAAPRFDNWLPWGAMCGALGLIPGVPAGFLLGTAIIVRSNRTRAWIGALFGLAVGVAYTWLWIGMLRGRWDLIAATVISGMLGGVILTLVQGAIRRRWGWWTRWDEPQAFSSSAVIHSQDQLSQR